MNTDLFQLFYQTTGVCTDTRKIEKDSLFVCLKGANFNGNTFASEALKAGAMHVIVDEAEYCTSPNIHVVENSLEFLQGLANHHRKKFSIPVIGITGSNGKTTSKELINAVLSEKYNVLATIGNLNNHIGVPLTLLRLNSSHEIAIIEMGANKFKDIEELCTIAEPNYGIITNIGKAHLEGFGGFEGVLKTKRELYESVQKNNGTIVFNSDDETLKNNIPSSTKSLSYGTGENNQVNGELISLTPYVKLQWSCKDYTSSELETKMVGKYNFYNYLAAITFGILFDVPYSKIDHAITNYTPENNRSQVKQTKNNTLILDCYNANPSSMKSAIESFAMIDNDAKTFFIGDMLELGDQSDVEHRSIIELIETKNLNGYTVGPLFGKLRSERILRHFNTKFEALEYLRSNPIEKHLILLKGSRGIGLEILEEVL